jgi:hypothetical protein
MTNLIAQDVVSSSESYRFIPLTKNQVAAVDAEDFEWLNQWQWCALKGESGYYAVRRNAKGKVIPMHSVIIKVPRGKVGDHWNGDTLDNRRRNLRAISQWRNAQNCCLSRNNTSGHAGVSFVKALGKWESYINVRGKKKGLGYFEFFYDAVEARRMGEIRYFGEVVRSACPPRITDWPTFSLPRAMRVNNTSGTVGVSLHRKTGKWMARVFTGKTTHYLGLHATRDAAIARIAAWH